MVIITKKGINLVWCLAFVAMAACNSLVNISPLSHQPLPATEVLIEPTILPPITPSPAAKASPTPVPVAQAAPKEAAPTIEAVFPTPEVDFSDLSPYRRAMLPDFAKDVDAVATAGVSRYYLAVKLDPESFTNAQNLRLSGLERVRYTNTEDVPLADLYFRLYPNLPSYGGQMRVTQLVVDNQVITPTLEADDSALRVLLPAPLLPGNGVDISLTYEVMVPKSLQSGYNIFSYSNDTLALAGFFPIIAVYDPTEGWDIAVPPPYGDATYLDTALFQVQLTISESMVVATSGSLLDSTINDDDTKTLLFGSGPMRDFYVVMRRDYQVASMIVDGVVINSYYPSDLEPGGQLALRYAGDALRIFNHHFGRYPYAEFDVVATPTTAGGIEYPGIVVVTERIYGLEGGFFEHATVHEVAHQWWYSLVGNDQIEEPWLDESLTNYSAILYWEEIRGPDTASAIMADLFFSPYEQAKEQSRDRAVIGPVSDFSAGEYTTFVYGKGPLFFHALRQEVGDEIYFRIMQTYYTDHKYKIATAQELFNTIEQVSERNVEPLVEMWLSGQ